MPDVRLIDGNALVKQIEETHCKDCNSYNGVWRRACEWMDAMDYIEDAPTIDAQPVKRGKWESIDFIKVGGDKIGMFQCSNCSQRMPWEANYCPGCGAKMEDNNGN